MPNDYDYTPPTSIDDALDNGWSILVTVGEHASNGPATIVGKDLRPGSLQSSWHPKLRKIFYSNRPITVRLKEYPTEDQLKRSREM